jgi:hypothetical protein
MLVYRHKKCVYFHRIGEEIFYIGQGTYSRPFVCIDRSPRWHEKVNQSGFFDIEIVAWFDSEQEARQEERRLIIEHKPYANFLKNLEWKDEFIRSRKHWAVVEITTGRRFSCSAEAGRALNISIGNICKNLKGSRPSVGGFKFKRENPKE